MWQSIGPRKVRARRSFGISHTWTNWLHPVVQVGQFLVPFRHESSTDNFKLVVSGMTTLTHVHPTTA